MDLSELRPLHPCQKGVCFHTFFKSPPENIEISGLYHKAGLKIAHGFHSHRA